jgi:hypothetical protein
MKKNILLITFLFLYINTYSQQNINYINNVVILKIKKDIKSDDIFEFFFSKLKKNFTDINILSITPIFPNISRESSNDKLGVDLSRIYKINYSPAYDPHSIADILMNTGTVEYAEPYYIPDLLYIPNIWWQKRLLGPQLLNIVFAKISMLSIISLHYLIY